MNRIPLYEALRRKKEAEGLNQTPQPQPVPQQKPRTEPRIQLKPSPTQAKQVPSPPKPLTKPVARPLVTLKGRVLKQPKQPSRAKEMVKELLNDKNLLKWAGIAAGIVIVLFLVLAIASRFSGDSQEQPDNTNLVVASPKETLNVNNVSPESEVLAPPAQEPVVQKPVVRRPEVPVESQPVKTQGTTKPEIPAAIQKEFKKPTDEKKPEPVKATSSGDNVIVITTYTKRDDLIPVVEYFKTNGIATEIIQEGSYYYVVSQSRFDTVNTPGTEGYQLKQKIKQVGANYKAPAGFERFASKPFQDVYGKKISK
ncbi:MAG: hypothetical protein ABFD91_19110 [Anaerohalosphaeraceae bacterium]